MLKNRLLLIQLTGKDKWYNQLALYQCACGVVLERAVSLVKSGHTKSCGCLKLEVNGVVGRKNRKHGDHKSPEYYSWAGAKNRCRNPRNKDYPNYGGRGIRFCSEWDDYRVFIADMGRRPNKTYSLDRIDVNGDYSKENCKWSTVLEQNKNRRVYMIPAEELVALRSKLSTYEALFGALPA